MNPFRLFKENQVIEPEEKLDIPQSPRYTPDLGWLEQWQFQLLFCPDETQKSHPEYKLIKDHSAFLANCYTQKKYDFWEQRVGDTRMGIPLPPSDFTSGKLFPHSLKIKGELHAVRPSAFLGIDEYRQNTEMFTRKRVNVLLPNRPVLTRNVSTRETGKELPRALQGRKIMLGTERVYVLRAWMYIGNSSYWDDLLDAGWSGFKPVKSFQSKRKWLGEYSYFTKHEFED